MKNKALATKARVASLAAIAWGAFISPVGAQAPQPVATPARTPVAAQPALLPALQIDSSVLGADGMVQVSLPPHFPLSASRFRLGLFEHGRPARVADIRRDFSLKNGRLQTTMRLEADPGAYDLRLVSDDKNRTPITAPALLLVPGIEREPGWWLVNGTPFLEGAKPDKPVDVPAASEQSLGALVENNRATATPATGSLFISGLQRDPNRGQKNFPPIRLQDGVGLRWDVLRLPPLGSSLERIDVTAFRNQLTAALKERQSAGGRNLFGILLPAPELAAADSQSATSMRQLRQTVREAAPNAALILQVEVGDTAGGDTAGGAAAAAEVAARRLSVLAAFADAVVIKANSPAASTWPVKAARRVAEEQPNFDLPIFLEVPAGTFVAARSNVQLLDYWMGGISGLIQDESPSSGKTNATNEPQPHDWTQLILRNLPLFAGSVTLEDSGLLPAPPGLNTGNEATTVGQYESLRALGRIPLLARLAGKDSRGESLMVRLEHGVSDETLTNLLETARAGARVYIEGAPLTDEKGTTAPAERWAKLTGATIHPIEPKADSLVLDDPWTFGTALGTRLRVRRTVEVKLSAGATSTRKPEKGLDILTAPRVLASFEDGSPALIVNPVERGEVIWLPDLPLAAELPVAANNRSDWRRYQTAMAAYVQPALVELAPAAGSRSVIDLSRIRVALRRSLQGTLLLAISQSGSRTDTAPATIAVNLLSPATVALDLATEEEIPLEKRGLQTRFEVTVPSGGWKLIAFGETREKLDDERNAPRLKAKFK